MALLGWPLLVTLGAGVVACTVVTLLLWSRVRGPAPARVGQRVALVTSGQLVAVLFVAVALNDYGYFYGSWSELLGTSVSAPAVVHAATNRVTGHHGGPPRAARFDPSLAGIDAWSTPTQWATRGRVEAVTLVGAHSGLSEAAAVYLPPQYFQKAYAHHRFPGVEVLTGYPGATRELVSRMQYPDVLLSQIDAHRARPMVLVMLRPTAAPPRDTECTDVPGGPQVLTFLGEDVPREVSHDLRVATVGWGVMGSSTGGYCAAKLLLTHSTVFTTGAALSGYYHTLEDDTTGDLWGGSAVLRDLNDPEWLLRHQPAPPVSLFATIGTGEVSGTGLQDTRRFVALVHPPMSVTSVVIQGGGHNFKAWSPMMPRALDFLSAHLAS
ncbi:Putative esterase [Pedococcus dokdonensis]|uniref:Putative esterase n=1 Tax=Pedococcus dokdonensis TaxID=443156 RepID=A0A1H0M6S3_9MICO|nr:alpha/beta hydrolase-fold protein [Pedococcus dokdonensis]SDO75991.1 Putative esterase [Pedococcus dokdonensis]